MKDDILDSVDDKIMGGIIEGDLGVLLEDVEGLIGEKEKLPDV